MYFFDMISSGGSIVYRSSGSSIVEGVDDPKISLHVLMRCIDKAQVAIWNVERTGRHASSLTA